MKCRKQPLWAKAEIKSVWEVRIDSFVWNKIICAAKARKKTYSWIVRYCVFELTRVKKLRWTRNMLHIHEKLKCLTVKDKKQHRHMLCLYGDDEIFLRNSALMLGITVSKLIRLSIAMLIDRVLDGKTSEKNLFRRGIKFFAKINIFRSAKDSLTAMVFHSYKKFLEEEYWGFT
ncbi:MAG: hypothetical protein OEZ22_13765 [Spirochaetia bacterium]|nr:hypothetical protein [Spirochaetia bacterium]